MAFMRHVFSKSFRFGSFVLLTLILLCLPLLSGCAGGATAPSRSSSAAGSFLSAYAPYWDADDALSEARDFGTSLETLIAFSAVFDSGDQPVLTEPAVDCLSALLAAAGKGQTVLLSVANDVLQEDGSSTQKDTELLRRVLGNDSRMDSLADALVKLCRKNGANGLEIDFENLKTDTALWQALARFAECLFVKTEEAGFHLRFVLTPDFPASVAFPEGPQYAVMAYNLYGAHSGPGPKADVEFLRALAARAASLPGQPEIVLASGGFCWSASGDCVSLTQVDAEALRQAYEAEPVRDEASGCLHFTYREAGEEYTVWMADAETFEVWKEAVLGEGQFSFSLWRLGGNRNDDLRCLFAD